MTTERYEEDEFLPLSALQHFSFCPRQCALIHIEQQWAENRLTAEGRLMHGLVDSGGSEARGDIRLERGLLLVSRKLGLVGKADMVEFHRKRDKTGKVIWHPFPVEYKRGRPKKENWDRIQLCAQAMCLEEMLNIEISKGALFYGRTRRRKDVLFDASLRNESIQLTEKLHRFVENGITPPAVYTKRCESCSLRDICIPEMAVRRNRVERYLEKMRRT